MDGLFTNNRDLTSQLGFLITIRIETRTPISFEITRNIIYYSSIKSRRVIYSILVLEIYRIVLRVDIAYIIRITLN